MAHLDWGGERESRVKHSKFGPKLTYFQLTLYYSAPLHSPFFSPQSLSFASELSIEDAVLELRLTYIVIDKVGQFFIFIFIIIDMIVFQMYEAS